MQIDSVLISKLEQLARLKLSDAEKQKLTTDLTNILNMVEKLQELNTEHVEPLIYISEEVNVMREDEVNHQLNQQAALSNAPQSDGLYFKVPKVIV